ncbi:hypothetical protein J6590_051587 [Homalodisca vitripennis]|nr:hypothetical protein J6590_051587 [Homalodisca vitripennis]
MTIFYSVSIESDYPPQIAETKRWSRCSVMVTQTAAASGNLALVLQRRVIANCVCSDSQHSNGRPPHHLLFCNERHGRVQHRQSTEDVGVCACALTATAATIRASAARCVITASSGRPRAQTVYLDWASALSHRR